MENKFLFVGGRNLKRASEPLRCSFLYSVVNPDDIEQLEDIKRAREQCSLCVVSASSLAVSSEKTDGSKIIVVGGYLNSSSNQYQNMCETLDLFKGKWSPSSRLLKDRLSPHLI